MFLPESFPYVQMSIWLLLLICLKSSFGQLVDRRMRDCKHFTFHPTADAVIGRLDVNLYNAQKELKISVSLKCSTLWTMYKPGVDHQIAGFGAKKIKYEVQVNPQYIHYDQVKKKHSCTLNMWTHHGKDTLVTCPLDVDTWPGGLFHYECEAYEDQLSVRRIDKEESHQIILVNSHLSLYLNSRPFYTVNITCSPKLPVLEHHNLYKSVAASGRWTHTFPKKCLGLVKRNYVGKCTLKAFHVCREKIFLAASVQYQFADGEIPECEALKPHYVTFSADSLASSLGLNDALSASLVIVLIVELILILILVIGKFIWISAKHGSHYAMDYFSDKLNKMLGTESTSSSM